jgi:hypothetical protein
MTKTLKAVFDGKVFRPEEEVKLEPNTRVEIIVKIKPKGAGESGAVDLEREPFVGMWSDREDMSDSSAWVRNVRETHWGK